MVLPKTIFTNKSITFSTKVASFFLDCLPLASFLYPQEVQVFLWGYLDSAQCFPIKRF